MCVYIYIERERHTHAHTCPTRIVTATLSFLQHMSLTLPSHIHPTWTVPATSSTQPVLSSYIYS